MSSAADPGVSRALALCGLALSLQAREVLVELLPATLAESVADWMRRSEELTTSVQGPVEEALLARLPLGDEDDREDLDDEEESETANEPPTCWPEVAIACLLAATPASGAARLLGELPLNMQGEVTALLATSTPLSVARQLRGQERPLLQALRASLGNSEAWGVHPACALLRALRGTRRLRRALTATAATDAEAATIVQSHLFDFDDLTRLRPQELQRLLARIDNPTLARALVHAGENVAADVFANTSRRRALLLQDELELQTEITEDEIEAARGEVMAEVRKLYERGDITTYFGSIHRVDDTEDEDPLDDDEDEEDGGAAEGPAADGQPAAAADGPGGVSLRLLVFVALAGLLLLSIGLLLPGPEPEGQGAARQSSVQESSGSSQGNIAVAGSDTTGDEALRLAPGERLHNTSKVDALLQFPGIGGAEVSVAPGARVTASESEPDMDAQDTEADATEADAEADADVDLQLRVGRVTVTVGAVPFTVETPVGRATGDPGSVFTVRVVLDATTTIRARHGTVQIHDRDGRLLGRIAAGQYGRVDGAGRVELSR